MAGQNIRVDLMFKTVKELQQEKSCLEQRLKELRAKRASLQNNLDTVTAKFTQVKDINDKMQETLKVAQYKVGQTQSQCNTLEDGQKKKRAHLASLNTEIHEQKESQEQELADFETTLSNLTKQFNEARQCHTPRELTCHLSEVHQKMRWSEAERAQLERETADIERRLQQVHMYPETADITPELPADDQSCLMKEFDAEENTARSLCGNLEKKCAELSAALQQTA